MRAGVDIAGAAVIARTIPGAHRQPLNAPRRYPPRLGEEAQATSLKVRRLVSLDLADSAPIEWSKLIVSVCSSRR